MRFAILALVVIPAAACAVPRNYLRPVADVRDAAAESLGCGDGSIVVRRLGSTAYEQTATVDAYSAEGCGRVAWFVCDEPESFGRCMEIPEPPYQTPSPGEPAAIVEVAGAWRGPMPANADRIWERVSFGDGYASRYLGGSPLSAALRPTARRMRIAVGTSFLEEHQRTVAHTSYVGNNALTTFRTVRWEEREHAAGCALDVELAPQAGATYRVEYEAMAGQCRARCAKLMPAGSTTCEGFRVVATAGPSAYGPG